MITGEDGKPKVQLIGIDGSPTNDDSIFGSRQNIFEHFENLYNAYTNQSEEPSIEDMYQAHTMALLSYSASYRRCEEEFDELFDKLATKIKRLDEIKNNLTSGTVTAGEASTLEVEAITIINDMYDIAYGVKKYYEGAVSTSNTARLMNMVMGYMEHGREFFNDEKSFEDTFTPYVESMFSDFEKVRKMLKFNARCTSAKDMITTI